MNKRLFYVDKGYTYTYTGNELAHEIGESFLKILKQFKDYDLVDIENIATTEIAISCCEERLTRQHEVRRDND